MVQGNRALPPVHIDIFKELTLEAYTAHFNPIQMRYWLLKSVKVATVATSWGARMIPMTYQCARIPNPTRWLLISFGQDTTRLRSNMELNGLAAYLIAPQSTYPVASRQTACICGGRISNFHELMIVFRYFGCTFSYPWD